MKILVKRAYEPAEPDDGYRVLVDRVWPRGRTREQLAIDEWAREIAPSAGLRKWFGHDPKRWPEFRQRYVDELHAAEQRRRLRELREAAGRGPMTLVYGAKDTEHNQAVVLQAVLGSGIRATASRARRLPAPAARSAR